MPVGLSLGQPHRLHAVVGSTPADTRSSLRARNRSLPSVTESLSNRNIAREINLSEHTVKKYLFHIFDKLGVSSRVELVLYAVKNSDPLPAEWPAHVSRPPPG